MTSHLLRPLLTLALSLPTGALAAERWEDGLTGRAPTTGYVAAAGSWVPGRDNLLFGDLRGGGPLFRSRHRPLSIGISGSLSTASVHTSDGRNHDGIRNAGMQAWMTFGSDDPDNATAHSLVVGLHGPIDGAETSWFLVTPNEVGTRFGFTYDAYLDLDGFDVSFEARAGLAEPLLLDVTWTAVALIEARDDLVVGGGATIGLLPFGTAIATARYRPTDAVEIGVGACAPFPLFDPIGTRIAVRPTAEIKAYW